MTNLQVEYKMLIHARKEIIYSYFVQPEKLSQWLGRSANLNPTYSGGLIIDMNGNDVVQGNYKLLEPYNRICFTWGWIGSEAHPPGSSIVEIILDSHDEGTWLTLTHTAIPEEEQDCHKEGWEQNLYRLRNLLQEGKGNE